MAASRGRRWNAAASAAEHVARGVAPRRPAVFRESAVRVRATRTIRALHYYRTRTDLVYRRRTTGTSATRRVMVSSAPTRSVRVLFNTNVVRTERERERRQNTTTTPNGTKRYCAPLGAFIKRNVIVRRYTNIKRTRVRTRARYNDIIPRV